VYQEWRDELIAKLGNLTYLSVDETNITPGAGARPGTNTEGGYAVFHLNDSLHGTAPVYIRFGFGTDSGTTNPRVQVTTGTSTNGSGVIGGTALSTIASISTSATQVTDTTSNSYLCAAPGFLGLMFKQTSNNYKGFFFINRTCDGTGAITATGAHAWWGAGGNTNPTKSQAFRYAATAAAYTAQSTAVVAMLGFLPQGQASTLVSGTIQVAMGWSINPATYPLFGVCGVLDNEVSAGTTFSVTLVGSTPRMYIGAAQLTCGAFGPTFDSTTGIPKFAMLWE
jgi:hypothetical protein